MPGLSQARSTNSKKMNSLKDQMKGDPKRKQNQSTIDGTKPSSVDVASLKRHPDIAGLFVDQFGNKRTCQKCVAGPSSHKAHQDFCDKSKAHKMGGKDAYNEHKRRVKGAAQVKESFKAL